MNFTAPRTIMVCDRAHPAIEELSGNLRDRLGYNSSQDKPCAAGVLCAHIHAAPSFKPVDPGETVNLKAG